MQRSLVGYSPWGRRESVMTEQLSLSHWSALQTKLRLSVCSRQLGSSGEKKALLIGCAGTSLVVQ